VSRRFPFLPAKASELALSPLQEDPQARLDVLLGASLRLLILGLPCALLWLLNDQSWPALAVGVSLAVSMIARAALQRGRNVSVWGGVFLVSLGASLFLVALSTGGLGSPALPWLILLPLIAALVFGVHVGMFVGAATALGIGGFWAQRMILGDVPHVLPPHAQPTFDLMMYLGAVAASIWIVQGWQEALRRAERRRRETEAQFHVAMQEMPEVFLRLESDREAIDPDGLRICYANPAAQKLMDEAEACGIRLQTMLGLDRAEIRRGVGRVLRRGGAFKHKRIEHEHSGRVYDLTVTPCETGIALVLYDITSHARQREHLREASRAAEETNRLKTEFLANMSHEIRTPMNGILGMAGLALQTDVDDEQAEYILTIRDCAESLLELLSDLIDLSKIESGWLEFQQLEFDIDELLDSVLDGLMTPAAERQLDWTVSRDEAIPSRLVGDPARLRQVLLNLAGNAIKFTEQGEVHLSVRLEETSEDQDVQLVFEVRDTGPGIAPERMPYLFEKFTQADGSTTRRHGGSGLGLTIAKKLVERMGGEIGVDSAPGKGARFWFRATFDLPWTPDPAEPAPPESLVGRRVMVVDDNETNRRVLAGQLRHLGCRYELLPDGASALVALKQGLDGGDPFHLVVSDQNMPGLNGADLAAAIRTDALYDDVSLVLLASVFSGATDYDARAAGFQARLTKPVRFQNLRSEILKVLGSHRDDPQREARKAGPQTTSRVLLVDDNPVNRRLATRMLEKFGVQTDTAKNGQEALDRLAEGSWDMILMDCQMPILDGYEAAEEIRRREDRTGAERVPIVAMTAHAMQGDREKCLASGMDDYLTKPLDSRAFLAVIERWLKPTADTR